MKAVFTRFFSVLMANTPPSEKRYSSRKFLSLFLIIFLAVGNAWADTQTYSFASSEELSNFTYTAGDGSDSWAVYTAKQQNVSVRDGGFVQYKCGKSGRIATFVTTSSFENISNISFYIASSDKGKTQVKIEVSSKADFSSDVTEIVNATGGLSGLGISSPSNNTWYSVSKSFASKSGYVRFTMTSSSSGKYWSFDDIVITYTPSSGGDPVCPSGLSITSKNDKTAFYTGDAIELTAALSEGNGAITYQWYKGGTAEGNKLAGKTAAKLEIASCVEGDAGDYYCVASKSDCSDAVNADAFTITVTHNPCATYFWFFNDADQTANGKTNATSVFSNMASGGSNLSGSITIDETTYNVTRRTGDTDPLGGFTVPANKAATFYALAVSSGDGARKIVLTNTTTSATYEADVAGGNTSYKRVQIDNIAPGTYSIGKSGGNTRLGMVALKVCDAIFHTIAFDSDGGSSVADLSVLDGTTAIQPTDPTWEHHRFDGWYNGETFYDWTANVTGDLTLTAHWTQLYTITYAAGDGTATGDAPTQVDKAEGETFTVAANTFEVAGKDFVNWNDGSADYAPGATYTVGTANVVLTAQWKAQADKYTVKFMDGETELGTKLFEVSTNPSDADIDKTKALNIFAAWQKEGVDIALDDAFWATVAKDAEITLTARWAAAYALNVNFKEAATQDLGVETALNTYHYASDASDISFEEKGLKIKTNAARFYFNVAPGKVAEIKFGNISGATYSVDGGAAETLTSSQLKATYSASAQSCVMTMTTAAYNIVEKVTIHDPFTVTFDANGGDDIAAVQGKPSITLPEPTNGIMSFKGWYDAATEGNKIGDAGEEYTPTADVIIYAQWEAQSTINTLSDLKVNGETVLGFTANEHTYRMVLPYKSALPMITSAIPTNANATFALWPKDGPEWTDEYDGGCYRQQVVVTPQDPAAEKGYYDIRITYAPKDGVAIISIAVPNGNGNEQTIAAANITGYIGGTATQKLQSGGTKLGSNGHYIGFTLANSETLKEGDVIRLNVSATNGASHLTLYQNASDANPVKDIEWAATTGVNLIPLPAEAAGLSTLYIYRKTAVCNPNLSEFTILRPTNPILKAITIDGRDGEIDEDKKEVTVELPFSSKVASMVVEPTIAWNAPAETNAIVVNDGSGWVVGDNTYVLTDKDGDQTTYTITLTQAAASSDATLATLTYNGTNITLVPDQYTYDIELPKGTTVVPTVTYTTNHTGATADMTDAADLPGATRIIVTAEDGATQEYVINFTVSRAISYVIYDGSLQQNIESRTGNDATGFSWSMGSNVTINGDDVPSSWNGKNYKHVIKGFKPNESTNNITTIVIPAGYLAKITLVGTTNSEGTERSLFIATSASRNKEDAMGDYIITSSDFNAQGFTTDYLQAGTYYLGSTEACRLYELSVVLYRIDYERDVRQGYYGTICLPNKGQMIGASIFEIAYKDASKIYFDEILNGKMKAGVPYIFLPNEGADKLTVFYTDEANASAGSKNGLVGSYTQELLEANGNNYILLNNQYCEVIGEAYVGANRAYFQLSGIPTSAPALAPGARRVSMGMAGQNTATGMENVDASAQLVKTIINGQLFILRGEKMYDAQGKLVK